MKKTARVYPESTCGECSRTSRRGFTLIELLIVVAIMVILAVVAWVMLNPAEWLAQARDGTRLNDLNSLRQVITIAEQESTAASVLCSGGTPPCSGNSLDGTRSSDGTGWVKVDLKESKNMSMPILPADPLNSGTQIYSYKTSVDGKTWEIDAVLESTKYKANMENDGGNDANVYEIGTNIEL